MEQPVVADPAARLRRERERPTSRYEYCYLCHCAPAPRSMNGVALCHDCHADVLRFWGRP